MPVTFADLSLAAYCPRKLYYARREDRTPPPAADRARALATQYPDLLLASDVALETHDLAVDPAAFRRSLRRARDRLDRWDGLVDPAETDVVVEGRHARGRIDKVLADPPAPVRVSPGEPPDNGVWEPQSVGAVAAAKALAWRERRPVETAYVEYPRYGVVRRIHLTGERKGAYRRALDALREMAGPPPRLHDDAKCGSCEYAERCGVRTRSLRSLLSPTG